MPAFRDGAELRIDYERELNDQQRAAVCAPPGPALVIAGAGAGKTRTLIYRVAFLLEQGIQPDRILLLTFTNKAASEMMRRVSDLLGGEMPRLWGGTFHSIGNRILRRNAAAVGHESNFTILDQDDAVGLVKLCIEEEPESARPPEFPNADVVESIFSMAVNTCRSLPETLVAHYPHFESALDWVEILERIRVRYAERKRESGAMDFDDLLALWLNLLEANADIREFYQRRFQFVLVDEYQDTNRLQGSLVDLLAARHANIMAVGDDAQSIYSWRGAEFRNILEFPQRYPKAVVYKIEANYRSTPEILAAANASIAGNAMQFQKQLAATRGPGMRPVVVPCYSARSQAEFVTSRILALHEQGVSLSEIAVLYRAHFHVIELQLELTRCAIPFIIMSGIRFFEQAHVKDATAFLKLACNPCDESAFRRVLGLIPGIGPKTISKLWDLYRARPLLDASSPKAAATAERLHACRSRVPGKAALAWEQYTATFRDLADAQAWDNPAKMFEIVLEACYEDSMKARFANYSARRDDLDQLTEFARRFGSLADFLSELSLLSSTETESARSQDAGREAVRLSTVHQAKGLEFGVVFVLMLCEGLFPSERSMQSPGGLEEERRLFYVAITRAKDELYLLYPLSRSPRGGGSDQRLAPSRFLREIPEKLLERVS